MFSTLQCIVISFSIIFQIDFQKEFCIYLKFYYFHVLLCSSNMWISICYHILSTRIIFFKSSFNIILQNINYYSFILFLKASLFFFSNGNYLNRVYNFGLYDFFLFITFKLLLLLQAYMFPEENNIVTVLLLFIL